MANEGYFEMDLRSVGYMVDLLCLLVFACLLFFFALVFVFIMEPQFLAV